MKTFDAGYGPIVDVTFARHRLFVLETFALDAPFTPDTGRVVREFSGRRTIVSAGLNFPVGMAHDGGRHLYVSTVSYGQGPVEGLGRIVRIRLDRRH